jgi:hypothetical protein
MDTQNSFADGLVQLESTILYEMYTQACSIPIWICLDWPNGNFGYIDTISSLVIDMINSKISGVYNVGT